jgi:hypothetical protein
MYHLKTGLKQYRWRLIPQLFLAAIVAVVLAAGSAQTSQAASLATPPHETSSHCQSVGALVESKLIKDGSQTIGEMDIYYNSSTGYNCAYVQGLGQARGSSTVKSVTIFSCKETTPGDTCNHTSKMEDTGDYLYYAGPVGVSAKGHCIAVIGMIAWKGENHAVWTRNASHCG